MNLDYRLLRQSMCLILHKYILRDFSPVTPFLLLGLPLFLCGALFGLCLWPRAMISGEPTPTGSIMPDLVPIVLGFQLLLQAIALDIQETPR